MSNLNDLSKPGGDGLQSLSQSARLNQLKSARGVLLLVGILTLFANLASFAMTESLIDAAINKDIEKVRGAGMMVDQAKVRESRNTAVIVARIISGGGVVIGVAFIVLGIVVRTFPVPATVLGMILYIGANAVFGFLNPASLAWGGAIIVKIIIIVALAKAIQAAIAYQREREAAENAQFGSAIGS